MAPTFCALLLFAATAPGSPRIAGVPRRTNKMSSDQSQFLLLSKSQASTDQLHLQSTNNTRFLENQDNNCKHTRAQYFDDNMNTNHAL